MNKNFKLSFFGASQEVTGSNYLLEIPRQGSGQAPSTKIIIDCGMFQGSRISEQKNTEPFKYSLAGIDAVIITHAHLDHVGRLPKLVRDGFKGKIYSTSPTRDLGLLMLEDSLGVLRKEIKRNGHHQLIYDEADIEKTANQWEAVDYHKEISAGDAKIKFLDAGHILGSAMVEVIIPTPEGRDRKIVFSGDLGNSPEPLISDTEKIKDADYLVVESTYGDREHESKEDADLKFERVIEETIHRKGVLMIPAFSLERTQKILFQIHEMIEHGKIPLVPVFLDSPLSIKATKIYKKSKEYFNPEAEKLMRGEDIFNFPGLRQTLLTEESKAINFVPAPKIIIAGSGMCNGGRILHHMRRNLSDKNSTVLLTSYQAVGSLGRLLSEGAKTVTIMEENILIKAKIEKIEGFSSHAGSESLFEFVRNTADTLKKVFVTHGEPRASLFFTQKIRDYLGIDAVAPETGNTFEINI